MDRRQRKECGEYKYRIQELRELYEDLDIVADIKKKRLEWIGHVAKIDQGRTVKKIQKIFESKPEGSRRRGRPKLRQLEDVQEDLRKMKGKRGDRRQSKGGMDGGNWGGRRTKGSARK